MLIRKALREELEGRLEMVLVGDGIECVGEHFKRLLVWRVVDQLPPHDDLRSARKELFSKPKIERRLHNAIDWVHDKVEEVFEISGDNMCPEAACSMLLGVMLVGEETSGDGSWES